MIQLSEITNSISPSLTRRLFNLAQKYDNVIDFTLGDPDIHPHDKKGKAITVKIACVRAMSKLITRKTSDYYRFVSLC